MEKPHKFRREYLTWWNMIARCSDSTNGSWRHYGARGIRVCDRWRESFENFLTDMGPRPSDRHSIDRINNDGNYEPINCRWATRSQQTANQRGRYSRTIAVNGVTRSINEWAQLMGVLPSTINKRLREGQTPEMAVSPTSMTVSEFARLGGLARAKNMTKAERSAAAKHAVDARERKRKAAKRKAKAVA